MVLPKCDMWGQGVEYSVTHVRHVGSGCGVWYYPSATCGVRVLSMVLPKCDMWGQGVEYSVTHVRHVGKGVEYDITQVRHVGSRCEVWCYPRMKDYQTPSVVGFEIACLLYSNMTVITHFSVFE